MNLGQVISTLQFNSKVQDARKRLKDNIQAGGLGSGKNPSFGRFDDMLAKHGYAFRKVGVQGNKDAALFKRMDGNHKITIQEDGTWKHHTSGKAGFGADGLKDHLETLHNEDELDAAHADEAEDKALINKMLKRKGIESTGTSEGSKKAWESREARVERRGKELGKKIGDLVDKQQKDLSRERKAREASKVGRISRAAW